MDPSYYQDIGLESKKNSTPKITIEIDEKDENNKRQTETFIIRVWVSSHAVFCMVALGHSVSCVFKMTTTTKNRFPHIATLLCTCFGHSRSLIHLTIHQTGRSNAMPKWWRTFTQHTHTQHNIYNISPCSVCMARDHMSTVNGWRFCQWDKYAGIFFINVPTVLCHGYCFTRKNDSFSLLLLATLLSSRTNTSLSSATVITTASALMLIWNSEIRP